MIPHGVFFIQQNRVIPPNHTLFSDPLGQAAKRGDQHVPLRRQILLDIVSIRGQRKLNIIRIIAQELKPVHHRQRILRPEHESVHNIGGKRYTADPVRVHRIADEDIPLTKPIPEPFGIVRGNVGAAACADDHTLGMTRGMAVMRRSVQP